MYRALREIHRRPAPFERETVAELWTDPHISSRMLESHLDGDSDRASRRTGFIDESAGWIRSRFGLAPGKAVADFGCGPGLYTSRLARSGAEIVGIDLSARSIGYARDRAREAGLAIDYRCADYFRFETSRRFDLITLIMCDLCALSPDRRAALLRTIRTHLAPGGALLLDVHSEVAFDVREEACTCAPDLMDGFWSAEPCFGFRNTFKYPRERVVLDKYTIVTEAGTRVVYNWLQCFTADSLETEIESAGLLVEEVLGDVAGGAFDAGAPEFAVVARRPAFEASA